MNNNNDVKKIEIEIIEKPQIKEKNTRVITKGKKWEYDNITYDDEIQILNDLKNGIKNNDTQLLKSEIKKKLSGYRNQDVLKKKYDEDKFISYEDTIKKLIDCGCKCLYCNGESKIFYKYVRDTNQWSLDRIDNKYGHNNDNVEISCLKCNLRRKTITTEKYILTKQIVNIKKI
tara:strand:- start:412 stop:933 length:522 start_codon:yes stop_codon:yes gene_type:complete